MIINNEMLFQHVTNISNLKSIKESGLRVNEGGNNTLGLCAEFKQRYLDSPGTSSYEEINKVKKYSEGKIFLTACNFSSYEKEEKNSIRIQELFTKTPKDNLIILNVALPRRFITEIDHTCNSFVGYSVRQNIDSDLIVPLPMRVAFRNYGEIGADYAPKSFVEVICPYKGNHAFQTEAIRHFLHRCPDIYYELAILSS